MLNDQKQALQYFGLLRLFMDNCPRGPVQTISPFGIHSISHEGKIHQIKPGQWYGPQTISIVLRNLCDQFCPVKDFKVHVCLDGTIIMDKIEKLINNNFAVLVLIPTRLGIDNIQQIYLDQVKQMF